MLYLEPYIIAIRYDYCYDKIIDNLKINYDRAKLNN